MLIGTLADSLRSWLEELTMAYLTGPTLIRPPSEVGRRRTFLEGQGLGYYSKLDGLGRGLPFFSQRADISTNLRIYT